MKFNIAEKIYYNPDLMYIIYQYDYTYLEKHKNIFKNSLVLLLEKAHHLWYQKYENALYINQHSSSILEFQSAFFDTLEQLGFIL